MASVVSNSIAIGVPHRPFQKKKKKKEKAMFLMGTISDDQD
jgi:hypothetical protein